MRHISRAALLGAMFVLAAISAGAEVSQSQESRGRALLERHCARCHAIGHTGTSSHPAAPPFRTLSQRYPIETLAEALGEGLSTGHPDMPEFIFKVEDVGAILAYLKSIQAPTPERRLNR